MAAAVDAVESFREEARPPGVGRAGTEHAVLARHLRRAADDDVLGRQQALPAALDPDGANLAGPRVDVLKQVTVDRLQVTSVEVRTDRVRPQLRRSGILELPQLLGQVPRLGRQGAEFLSVGAEVASPPLIVCDSASVSSVVLVVVAIGSALSRHLVLPTQVSGFAVDVAGAIRNDRF